MESKKALIRFLSRTVILTVFIAFAVHYAIVLYSVGKFGLAAKIVYILLALSVPWNVYISVIQTLKIFFKERKKEKQI